MSASSSLWCPALLAMLAAGCAGTGPAPRDIAPAPVASAPTPSAVPDAASPTRASLGPGEIVCGVDDGPVPIGRTDEPPHDELRRARSSTAPFPVGIASTPPRPTNGPFFGEMMPEPPEPTVDAARPEVKLAWTLGPKLQTTPAFEQRAHACGELAELADLGQRTFNVQRSAHGGPVATRDRSTSSSKFSTCLASSLCLLGPGSAGTAGEITDVAVLTKVTPPQFQGRVEIEIADERQGTIPTSRRGRSRRVDVPPSPRPAASEAYAKQLAKRLQPGAQACAAKRPPAQSFVSTVVFVWGKEGKRALPTNRGRRPLVDAFDACLSAAADAVLTRPPPSFNPNDRIPIIAQVDVQPSPALAPEPPRP